ncbi:hypothetical protein PV10_03993 [Exophiala mesophila]|uniref:GYF domain-containing protein n=1 Tax=Exophiala mesophila TaxID=212818 RepID=A0A0D1ZDE3_EXOME|nr:uncharacterized protein PV10_03993 [Exophiala mesophila]KIV92722.1 hypothetical protein PV10_03993 [Exophiala mesophila]
MSSYPKFTKSNKRALAESYIQQSQSSNAKKPRFDTRNPSALAAGPDDALDEEDEAVLAADVIGPRGQQVRRGAVNIDGYDSDSDNDNFNARADERARKSKAEEQAAKAKAKAESDDDNDMFADLEEDFKDGERSGDGDSDEDGLAPRKKKKAVRFLQADQIVGQVETSKSGGHVSADFSLSATQRGKGKGRAGDIEDQEVESSSESEVDDAVRASVEDLDPELGAGSKKTHAPKLDAFNMKSELEEGGFDDQENYVRKKVDPDAQHDVWLEGLSKKEMRRAKEAADRREIQRRERALQDDAVSSSQVLATLIPLLEKGETILESLARLGKRKDKKPKWQTKNKNKRQNGTTTQHQSPPEDDVADKTRRQQIEKITEAADALLTRGQPDIYDCERELLVRQYKRETGEDWIDATQPSVDDDLEPTEQLWEYRWTDARDGGTINGPYDANTMQQWNSAGYFGDGVEFRRKNVGDWTRVAEFA